MSYKKYLAELLGTFSLGLAVSLSLTLKTPLSTPIIAGLTLGLFVYTVGSISGAHLNPAVTIALASIRKISGQDAIGYIIAQILGAWLALKATAFLSGGLINLEVNNDLTTGIAEAIGAFFLCFGMASVAYGKVKSEAAGLTIGTSFLLGILIAGSQSNGILNPAISLTLKSVSTMYLVGPIVGALLGAWAYKFLVK